MEMRILLLLSIVWIIRLTASLFYIGGRAISGRDLILIGGGLFLLAKATTEIQSFDRAFF
jgi:predicted tellurium resistance membrane protein TerC